MKRLRSHLVVSAAGELLLQKRTDKELWGLPGGAMNIGEATRRRPTDRGKRSMKRAFAPVCRGDALALLG
jgi:hypothetical protein